MSVPSVLGLPQEMKLAEVDFSLPNDARSYAVKIQPSNVQSIASQPLTMTASQSPLTGLSFPSQTVFFDIPCGQSPSTFLDTRFTTLSFNVTCEVVVAGSASVVSDGYTRSGGYSWFDRMYVTAQNGNIIEDITEYGLTYDTLVALQLDSALRDTLALQYGFLADPASYGAQGHAWGILGTSTDNTLAAGQIETHSYSIPLLSAVVGMGSDKFLNIGRTSKLQIALQTATEIPVSIITGTATTAGTIKFTISNMALQCEYIDIGLAALNMLDNTLIDNKAYCHGITYKTSGVSMPSAVGTQSLLAGIRGSSIKSLFTRFYDQGAAGATSGNWNGKYESKNPNINAINYNVGGMKFPTNPVNPLYAPSQAFRALQMAIGSFNNSQFQSAIVPPQYCRLAQGGTAQALTVGGTQDYNWSTNNVAAGTAVAQLCQFIYGENLEVCARRGLMSGLNASSAPVFVELNISSAPTNAQQVYVMAMLDQILIHDVRSGDIQVRI